MADSKREGARRDTEAQTQHLTWRIVGVSVGLQIWLSILIITEIPPVTYPKILDPGRQSGKA